MLCVWYARVIFTFKDSATHNGSDMHTYVLAEKYVNSNAFHTDISHFWLQRPLEKFVICYCVSLVGVKSLS